MAKLETALGEYGKRDDYKYVINRFSEVTPEQKAMVARYKGDLKLAIGTVSTTFSQGNDKDGKITSGIRDINGKDIFDGIKDTKSGSEKTKILNAMSTLSGKYIVSWGFDKNNKECLIYTLDDRTDVANNTDIPTALNMLKTKFGGNYKTLYMDAPTNLDDNLVKTTEGFSDATIGAMKQVASLGSDMFNIVHISPSPVLYAGINGSAVKNPITDIKLENPDKSDERLGATVILVQTINGKESREPFGPTMNNGHDMTTLYNHIITMQKGYLPAPSKEGLVTTTSTALPSAIMDENNTDNSSRPVTK